MSLGEHMVEIRNRLFICAVFVVVFTVLGWFLYPQLFALLEAPFHQLKNEGKNVNINIAGVAGAFETRLRLSAYVGVALSFPVMVYELWAFITPGLHKNERRYALGFLIPSIPLFLFGLVFGYFAITRAVPILMSFTGNVEAIQLVEFQSYIELVVKTCMIFGLAFIFPVLLVAFNLVGVLPARKMLSGWRWAIFLSFFFTAAMVPTPDPVTLFLVTTPFLALFFGAVAVAAVFDKRKARRERKQAQELSVDQASDIDLTPAPIDLPASIDDAYPDSTPARGMHTA